MNVKGNIRPRKRVEDNTTNQSVMADWLDLTMNVPSEKLIDEIAQQLPEDVFKKLVEGLKQVFPEAIGISDSKNIAFLSRNKIRDTWTEADHAAAFAIDTKDIIDLYIDGIIEVEIPSGINSKEFANACIRLCKELWSDKEINFDYGNVNFEYIINGNILTISINN